MIMNGHDPNHDQHMRELCGRISDVLAGEKLTDAASACAMCCAFAIVESAHGQIARGRLLAVMTDFMRKMVIERGGQQP